MPNLPDLHNPPELPEPAELPNIDPALFNPPALPREPTQQHPPRILLLYGSVRERSYSRLASEEAARIFYFGSVEWLVLVCIIIP